MTKKHAKALDDGQLRQLNLRQHEAELSVEKHAHAITKSHLVKIAAELAQLRAQVAAREAREQADGSLREAKADAEAARKQLHDLTTEIRRTHNLTEKHAIDGATGAILLPEG